MAYKGPKTVVSDIVIGVGFIVFYFILIAFLPFCGFSDTIAETVIKCFTCIIGILIAFYFGFRTVEEYMKLKEKQAKCEDEGKEPEQKQDTHQDTCLTASSVNYLSVVGGFAAAAGVTLLSLWIGMYSSLTGSMKYILLLSAFFVSLFSILMIKGTYQEAPPKEHNLIRKKIQSYLCCAGVLSVVIVFILSLLGVT